MCELSCFCNYCIDGGDWPYDNYTHVQPWDLVTLKPCSPIDAWCDLEIDDKWEVFHDGDSLVACLEIGECFVVVITNDAQFNVGF